MGEFISPRKADELAKEYHHNRFEAYMRMVDDGSLPREIALRAMAEEHEWLILAAEERKKEQASNAQEL